ncbi:hypothetical protein [Methyloligella solikamskensis]|uniref:Uncharacterized protein n=1 Tax=Methyloligella solikamskensis TaxID=1177756 RepID=A0ABW3JD83_9HYPH
MEFLNDTAGWLWVIGGIGVVCLGGALVYGITMDRKRETSVEVERAREQATAKHYKEPEGQKP